MDLVQTSSMGFPKWLLRGSNRSAEQAQEFWMSREKTGERKEEPAGPWSVLVQLHEQLLASRSSEGLGGQGIWNLAYCWIRGTRVWLTYASDQNTFMILNDRNRPKPIVHVHWFLANSRVEYYTSILIRILEYPLLLQSIEGRFGCP